MWEFRIHMRQKAERLIHQIQTQFQPRQPYRWYDLDVDNKETGMKNWI